jgi:hypothetical protein
MAGLISVYRLRPGPAMTQVMVYIDGFNVYHGLKAKHGRAYLWLDLAALARRLLKPGQVLEGVKYFTASDRNDPAALARQSAYLGALRATSAEVSGAATKKSAPPAVPAGRPGPRMRKRRRMSISPSA